MTLTQCITEVLPENYIIGARQLKDIKRFLARVQIQDDNCWIWTGKKHMKDGYGEFRVNYRYIKAHRWSYELYVGSIPEGTVIDHLCMVRLCVNPAHLEAVIPRVNSIRAHRMIRSTNELYLACKQALEVFDNYPELPSDVKLQLSRAIANADVLSNEGLRIGKLQGQ